MADNVQFILDRMSATLRRLEELKLFSTAEVKSIVKKRTDYEYVMRRRLLTPADFYGYLQFELNLDKLRVMRCDYNNVGKERADAFRTVEGACLRHISYIFDRAIRRFPSEMGLWADYVSFLKDKKLISALNAVFGKALSLNPKNESLWLQAAVHELDVNNNLHSARTLLQRSLRANKTSHKLWKKYFELELWNAVRITERQRILGLEVDNSPIQGAPQVVFKHALISLPSEVEFACELHKSSLPVSLPLADALEKMLLQTFGGSCQFWSYLAGLSFDRHAIQLDVSDNRLLQGRLDNNVTKGTEGKKRKRGKASAYDIITYVAKSLDTCSKVLDTAERTFRDEDTDISIDEIESAKLPITAMCAVSSALEQASTFIGRISQASFTSFPTVAPAAPTAAELSSETPSKKKRTEESLSGTAVTSTFSSQDVSRSLAHLSASLDGISEHIVKAKSLALSEDSSSLSVFSAQEALATHRLWLLRSVFVPTSSTGNAMDTRQLIAWCVTAAADMADMFKRKSTSIRTSEKALGEIIAAWIEVAEAALKGALRSWALSSIATEGKEEDHYTSLETVRLAGEMVMGASALISSTSDGCDSLHRTAEVLLSAGFSSVVSKGLKSIVSSPHCLKGMRGLWCTQLVKLSVTLDNEVEKKTQDIAADSEDEDDEGDIRRSDASGLSAEQSRCEVIYHFIEGVFNSQPELLVGAEIQSMYDVVLSIGMKAATSDKNYSFVRAVADRAIENCPSVIAFWDTCEGILRSQGKHQEASHIRWRRDRECQQ